MSAPPTGKVGGKKPRWARASMARNEKNELITKDNYTEQGANPTYGRVIKILGGHDVLVFCALTNREHRCIIRGKMRNRGSAKISPDDIVLVDLREMEGGKGTGDIIIRYSHDESNKLKNIHEEVASLLNASSNMPGSKGTKIDADVEFTDEIDFENL
jgi:initiation factor 1A